MTKLGAWQRVCFGLVICVAAAIAAQGQTFNSLVSFDLTNGATPWLMSLVQDRDASLFGTTSAGGAFQWGTVFKISVGGKLTTLHTFTDDDGVYPYGALVLGIDGNLYGTTEAGGENSGCADYGCGTAFKITPQGQLTTIYTFCAQSGCADGAHPGAGLLQAADGSFYGTTTEGGTASNSCTNGCGTVFRITPAGILTTLYRFCSQSNCADGSGPTAGLTEAADGSLFGTTVYGGIYNGGTIFQIYPRGALTTLHSFSGADGARPVAGLVRAADGNFYGTTYMGGANCSYGCGTVFEMTPVGKLTTLHSFDNSDGANPYDRLLQASDGNFYGTTQSGGGSTYGTVFEITPSGVLTTLYNFCSQASCTDGAYTNNGLAQDTNGNLYGTTFEGGDLSCGLFGCGNVFSLDVGLGPFVAFVRSYGKVGQTGGILGQGFKGTSSVSLNGTPAKFTVVSDTFIKATVPAGATTGYVTVTTPSGVLTSNVPFRVLP
jgi:uncharacterized repeat protein (TIGR03803 family)